jgi:nicotinamide phosphoribosyltransferase
MNVKQFFIPSADDIEYERILPLKISVILRMDSYKFSHPFAYREEHFSSMVSYGSSRLGNDHVIIPAGMQILVNRYLTEKITMEDVDAAEQFALAHFGAPLFYRKAWERVVNVYGGSLPLAIRAVPEGLPVTGGVPLYTVAVFDDPICAWMSAGFETLIQRGIWYPTTIATLDYQFKQELREIYRQTGADEGLLGFALHDFGGRGVSSGETAEIGGAAHLFNFMGSDTVEGVLTANHYYSEPMSAFSVYATEHAIECSFGPTRENAVEYIRHQLRQARKLGVKIVSIVLDGYNVYREGEICCTDLRDEIIEFGKAGGKVVFRPDSGDMMEVVPRLLRMQEEAFGAKKNDRGYKQINYVGIIQGDGVDRLSALGLLGKISAVYGYCADCVVFGSGGALLQKVNRDTLKFAQKAASIYVGGEWVGISKNPVTDSGKKSLEGVLTTVRNAKTGEYSPARLDQGELSPDVEDVMQLVYSYGRLYNKTILSEVRTRLA